MKKIFVILKILFFFFFFLGQTKLLISKEEAEPTLEIPPKLLAPIETKIPEGTLYPSDEVVVTLELDVNTKGEVETLRLQKSSGEPFDSVAKEAHFNPLLPNMNIKRDNFGREINEATKDDYIKYGWLFGGR